LAPGRGRGGRPGGDRLHQAAARLYQEPPLSRPAVRRRPGGPAMSLISVKNVSFGYTANRRILDDVSLDMAEGETIGLVGESGSGNTSHLRLMLGLARPDCGTNTFDRTPLDPRNSAFMRDYPRQAQVVFQDPYS